MIDWLECNTKSDNDEPLYSLDVVRSKYEVRKLATITDGWLVLNWDKEKFNLNFAVLAFYQSDIDDKNILTECIMHGWGPSGSLRECRHTYWGDEGYLFYPDGKLIAAAFKALSEFYDDMA